MLSFQSVSAHPSGNCHLLCTESDAVLIDASMAFCGAKTAEIVKVALGTRRLCAIILSHSHYDHTAGLPWLHRAFPDTPVFAHPIAIENFARPGAFSTMRALSAHAAELYAKNAALGHLPDDCFLPVIPCADRQILGMGGGYAQIHYTPGHTRDSISVDFPEEGVLWLCESLGFWDGKPGGTFQPCYLSGYRAALDSLDRMMALGSRRLILSHSTMLDEFDSAAFLMRSRQMVIDCAGQIVAWHREGLSQQEMLPRYQEIYYDERYADLQPLRAFLINAEATIRVTLKELCENS